MSLRPEKDGKAKSIENVNKILLMLTTRRNPIISCQLIFVFYSSTIVLFQLFLLNGKSVQLWPKSISTKAQILWYFVLDYTVVALPFLPFAAFHASFQSAFDNYDND